MWRGWSFIMGKLKQGIGGGICQLSNLIYWMTIHTPLTVTQRYRHSYDVFSDSNRTQPFGSGATCAYNYLDLQIKNETNSTYQLVVYLTDTHLVGEWRSDALLFGHMKYMKKNMRLHWKCGEDMFGTIKFTVKYLIFNTSKLMMNL